jgi:uncharacterized protein (DUF433 family)
MISREQSAHILYGEFGPRDLPRYTLADAARYVRVKRTTLQSWVRGRDYLRGGQTVRSEPLIQVSSDLLSFSHLIELHLLRALRREEDVSMSKLREAIREASTRFKIERLLLSRKLRTAAGEVLLDHYGDLVELSPSQQIYLRHVFDAYLKRVDWDNQGPAQFFPSFVSVHATPPQDTRLVVINPEMSFGNPVIKSRGIRVSAIVSRIDAGETEDEVAQDYGLTREEIDAAIGFNATAAA